MKRLFALLCCATMLAACANGGKRSVENDATQETGATMISNKISGDLSALAEIPSSITIEWQEGSAEVSVGENGKFFTIVDTYEGDGIHVIVNDDVHSWCIADGSDVSFVYKDEALMPIGSALDDKWGAYCDEIAAMIANIYCSATHEEAEAKYQAVLQYMVDFMYANMDSVLSLNVLSSYINFGGDDAVASDIFNKIDRRFAVLESYKSLKTTIVGAELIDLALPNAEGEIIRTYNCCL